MDSMPFIMMTSTLRNLENIFTTQFLLGWNFHFTLCPCSNRWWSWQSYWQWGRSAGWRWGWTSTWGGWGACPGSSTSWFSHLHLTETGLFAIIIWESFWPYDSCSLISYNELLFTILFGLIWYDPYSYTKFYFKCPPSTPYMQKLYKRDCNTHLRHVAKLK